MYHDFLCLNCDEQFSAHWPTEIYCPECGSFEVIELTSGYFAKMIDHGFLTPTRQQAR